MSDSTAAWKEEYNVDVKFCYPFIEAVLSTVRTQCQLTPKAGPPGFSEKSRKASYGVLIQACISGEKTMATITLCFSKEVFLKVMGRMLGEDYTEINDELEDGAKEMMNVVFNQAKKPLAEKGLAAIRSIPTVIIGHSMYLRYLSRSRSILLPFDTEVGTFHIEMSTQTISVSDTVTP